MEGVRFFYPVKGRSPIGGCVHCFVTTFWHMKAEEVFPFEADRADIACIVLLLLGALLTGIMGLCFRVCGGIMSP